MSKFVLRPAHIRSGKFVPDRDGEPVEMDWDALVKRFAPSQSRMSHLLLRGAKPGLFIGTRKLGGETRTFTFDTAGRSRDASRMLKTDPKFEESVIEVFLVDRVDWGMQLQELGAV